MEDQAGVVVGGLLTRADGDGGVHCKSKDSCRTEYCRTDIVLASPGFPMLFGPRRLNITGRNRRPWNSPKTTTRKKTLKNVRKITTITKGSKLTIAKIFPSPSPAG